MITPTSSIPTTYTVDLAAGLTQVLVDGTNGILNRYLYGNGRIAQFSASTPTYFLPDALGSVRQLADLSGAVTLTKSYQPYGSVMSTSGSGSSSYGFTGEWTDNTGLVYLRARYYAPGTGRFVTRDTWPGDYRRPLSMNGFGYTEGNPLNRVDPTGQCYWPFGGLRKVEPVQCSNLDKARAIYLNSKSSLAQRTLAGYYISTWATAHASLLVGAIGTFPIWGPIVALASCSQPSMLPTVTPSPTSTEMPVSEYAAYGFSMTGFDESRLQTLGVTLNAYANAVGGIAQLKKLILADSGGSLETIQYIPSRKGAGRNTGSLSIDMGSDIFDIGLAQADHYSSWGASNGDELAQRVLGHEIAHILIDVLRQDGEDWAIRYQLFVKRPWQDSAEAEEEAAVNLSLKVHGAPFYYVKHGLPESDPGIILEIDTWVVDILDELKSY